MARNIQFFLNSYGDMKILKYHCRKPFRSSYFQNDTILKLARTNFQPEMERQNVNFKSEESELTSAKSSSEIAISNHKFQS